MIDVYEMSHQLSTPQLLLRLSTCVIMPSCVVCRSTPPPRARLRGRTAWCWWRTTSQMLASGHASRYRLRLWHDLLDRIPS
jgi:hypothetical protein